MIPIYLACRSSVAGATRALRVYEQLRPHGFAWTMDWATEILNDRAAGVQDHDLPFEEKRRRAQKDADGVRAARIFVYLEDEKSEGAACEGGLALAEHKTFYAVCPSVPRCLFVCLADRIFKTDEELVDALIHDYTLDTHRSAR